VNNMENKIRTYFKIKDSSDWHRYKIGEYHVSSIGCSHKELDPQTHYGPCLRATYYAYTEPEEKDLKTIGNLLMGEILHKIVQERYKGLNPNAIIEYPVTHIYGNQLTIKGSIDILDLEDGSIRDVKSASLFTFPGSEYDYNPTHIDQVSIYAALLKIMMPDFILNKLMIIYVKKHNLETIEQVVVFDREDVGLKFGDYLSRVVYLDLCLTNKREPKAEPHRWCKFCSKKEHCLEQGDIIETKKKGRYILNEL